MILATPGQKILENGPELEFRSEFLLNFGPSYQAFLAHFNDFDASHHSYTQMKQPESSYLFNMRQLLLATRIILLRRNTNLT
jgi:hypothetical protein